MIQIVGRAECLDVDVESEPWNSLDVSWQMKARADTLYLMVHGSAGGYVELKVDSADGALVEMVVVNDPPAGAGYDVLPDLENGSPLLTPTLDLSIWTWKVTPDYSEPEERISRTTGGLAMSRRADIVTVTFGEVEPVTFMGGGPVRIGVGAGGELSCLVAVPTEAGGR